MADGDQRQVAEFCFGLAKAKERSAADVEKDPRLSADPEEITGRRAIAVDPGSARAQDLDCHRIRGAALSRRGGRDGEKGEQANNRESNHRLSSRSSLQIVLEVVEGFGPGLFSASG